jgi:predicted 2-oxoglutarate/Fe(II)-dependent dioxygenase YbiX
MSEALLDKLSQKRNLEAQWASEFIANGSVTVKMVEIRKKIDQLAQELKEDSEIKALISLYFAALL